MVNATNATSATCFGFQMEKRCAFDQFNKHGTLTYTLAWTNVGFNMLLSGIAVFCNIKILVNFSNKQTRKGNFTNILLFNLAMADVLVGLFILPSRVLLLGATLLGQPGACHNAIQNLFEILQNTFSTTSFHAILMVTIEKYISVVHCMKYTVVITKARMVTAALSGWFLSSTFGLLTLFTPRVVQLILFFHITWVCFTLAALNLHLFLVAKSQRTKIYLQRLSVRCQETHPVKKYLKAHKSVSMATAMITLCYFPQAVISFIFFVGNNPSISPFHLWSATLFLAASSLNPFVHFKQVKESSLSRKRAIYKRCNV